MKMHSGKVTAMMRRAVMIRAAMMMTMAAKAVKARAEARTNRRLQEGKSSRKANQQRAESNSKDKTEGQPRA